jgi:hypothetical protein
MTAHSPTVRSHSRPNLKQHLSVSCVYLHIPTKPAINPLLSTFHKPSPPPKKNNKASTVKAAHPSFSLNFVSICFAVSSHLNLLEHSHLSPPPPAHTHTHEALTPTRWWVWPSGALLEQLQGFSSVVQMPSQLALWTRQAPGVNNAGAAHYSTPQHTSSTGFCCGHLWTSKLALE